MAAIKKSPALVAEVLGAILAIVGLVLTFMCSGMSEDYALASMGMYAAEIVAAVVLVALAAWSATRDADNGIIGLAATAVSVFLLVNVAVSVVGSRILLASGLFTWNSANQVGWSVWNSTITAVVVLLVAGLVLVVGAFLPQGKKQA